MIVEPVPTSPRSPLRRALRVLGVAMPVVLLACVVAVGALGPQPVSPALPVVSPAGSEVAVGQEPASPQPDVVDARGHFPDTWFGLPVRGVADTLAARIAGGASGVVAVSGYLDYRSLPWTCVDAYLDEDREPCERRTVLAGQAGMSSGSDASPSAGIGPHLHPVFPAGVRGPAPDDRPGSTRAEPIPVVVLGSFASPQSACPPTGRRCDEGLVVDRVVWVAGASWGPTVTIDPALRVEPDTPGIRRTVDAATRALGPGAFELVTAVVTRDALDAIDPAAAAALPQAPDDPTRPVTYLRGLVFRSAAGQPLHDGDPAVGWVVLDSLGGRELARGGAASALASGGPTDVGSGPAGSVFGVGDPAARDGQPHHAPQLPSKEWRVLPL